MDMADDMYNEVSHHSSPDQIKPEHASILDWRLTEDKLPAPDTVSFTHADSAKTPSQTSLTDSLRVTLTAGKGRHTGQGKGGEREKKSLMMTV